MRLSARPKSVATFAGPLRSLVVAIVLILFSALMPSWSPQVMRTRETADMSVRQLRGAEAQKYVNERVRTQLENARAQGLTPLETTVFIGIKKQSASFLDRFLSLHADTHQFDQGVVVFTVLDDGDYNTVEYHVHIYDTINNYELWGIQQMDLSTQSTSEWDIGIHVNNVAQNGSWFGKMCGMLSPVVAAQAGTWQGRSCGNAGALFRGVLGRAAMWGGGAFAGAAFGCLTSTVAWGVCVSGAATGGFVFGIIVEAYDAGTTCGSGGWRRSPPEFLPTPS